MWLSASRFFKSITRNICNVTRWRCSSSNAAEFSSDKKQRKRQNELIRLQLAASYRALNWYGLNEGLCNHLSAKAPDPNDIKSEVILLIPFGTHWEEVIPTKLIGINDENVVIEGEGEPEVTALCIHRGIYNANPNVTCVMHTHMKYATSLCCLESPELLMIHQNSARFYNRIAYDSKYGGLGDTFEEGKRLGEILRNKDVLFMGNHGVITVGDCVAVPFDNMYYLERAAMIQVTALSTGQKLKVMTDDVLKIAHSQIQQSLLFYATTHLNYAIRKLQMKQDEFKL